MRWFSAVDITFRQRLQVVAPYESLSLFAVRNFFLLHTQLGLGCSTETGE